jgi:hypothetical protein
VALGVEQSQRINSFPGILKTNVFSERRQASELASVATFDAPNRILLACVGHIVRRMKAAQTRKVGKRSFLDVKSYCVFPASVQNLFAAAMAKAGSGR